MGEIECHEDKRKIELVFYAHEMDERRRLIRIVTVYKKDMTLVVKELLSTPLETSVAYYASVKLTPHDYEEITNMFRKTKTVEDYRNLIKKIDELLKDVDPF